MRKIKKGDNVIVITGKDRGKTGEVLMIVEREQRTLAVVQGVNVVKKHQKPNQALGIAGGILDIEKPIDISNIMLQGAKGKRSRAGFEIKDGKKTRIIK